MMSFAEPEPEPEPEGTKVVSSGGGPMPWTGQRACASMIMACFSYPSPQLPLSDLEPWYARMSRRCIASFRALRRMVVNNTFPVIAPLDSPLSLKIGVVHGQNPELHATVAFLRRVGFHVSALRTFLVHVAVYAAATADHHQPLSHIARPLVPVVRNSMSLCECRHGGNGFIKTVVHVLGWRQEVALVEGVFIFTGQIDAIGQDLVQVAMGAFARLVGWGFGSSAAFVECERGRGRGCWLRRLLLRLVVSGRLPQLFNV